MIIMPISDALAHAFGWALLHSLWQATLAALILLLLLPRLKTARTRYRLAYGTLLSVLFAATVTFGLHYQFPSIGEGGAVPKSDFNTLTFNAFSSESAFDSTGLPSVSAWLEGHYPLVVTLWLLGFAFFLLRLAGGLWYVRRLRHEGLFLIEAEWQTRLTVLSERLSQSRPVALFQSALVSAPVAIGYLKPVILLPIGLLNQLSAPEVEAVLAHELAHIARRDWLFNLLQAFIESLFYFHPAVWWISGMVRHERENCCDDTAVALCGNPLHYAKALLRVQEMAVPVSTARLALGLDGGAAAARPAQRRMFLLERIRRILNQPQHKSHNMEKSIATAALLALLIFVGLRANTPQTVQAAFAQLSDFTPDFFKSNPDEYAVTGDSLPKPRSTRKIVREDDQGRVEADYLNGKLTRLNIDGKEIPATEFEQHSTLTEALLEESVPPIPPMPPIPPGSPVPAAPPAPGADWNWPTPPAPPGSPAPAAPPAPGADWSWPTPPPPPAPPHIKTTKGSDGSIILQIENKGENPVEIRVKDGETWVDGRKLAEGEALELPGFHSDYHFPGSTGEGEAFGGFHFEGLAGLDGIEGLENIEGLEDLANMDRADLLRVRQQALEQGRKALEEARREMGRTHKEMEKDMKRQRKEMERQRKESQKEYEASMREVQRSHEQVIREQEQAMRAHQQALRESERARGQMEIVQKSMAENRAFWRDQLRKDGILTESGPTGYSMKLSNKELEVNGKKQSDELHQKYLEIYNQRSGGKNKLEGKASFTIRCDE